MPTATTLDDLRAANGRPVDYHGPGFTLMGGLVQVAGSPPVSMRASRPATATPTPRPAAPLPRPAVQAARPAPQVTDAEFLARMSGEVFASRTTAPRSTSAPKATASAPTFAGLAAEIYATRNR